MKKYFLTNKNGLIRATSDGVIEYDKDKLELHQVVVSQKDLDRINHGELAFVKKSKLVFKTNPEKEKKDRILKQIDDAKDINQIKEIVKQLV